MKKRLCILLASLMALTSAPIHAEEQDTTELATTYLRQAYDELSDESILLAEQYVQTTTSAVLQFALTDLKEIAQKIDEMEALPANEREPLLEPWAAELATKVETNDFLKEISIESTPRFFVSMGVNTYNKLFNDAIQAYNNTFSPTDKITLLTLIDGIAVEPLRAALESDVTYKENTAIQAEQLTQQAEQKLISPEIARSLVNQLPDGEYKNALLTRLTTVEGSIMTLEQFLIIIKSGFASFNISTSELEANLPLMTEQSTAQQYLTAYNEVKTIVTDIQTNLSNFNMFAIQIKDAELKQKLWAIAFLTHEEKAITTAFIDNLYATKLTSMLTTIKQTNSATESSNYTQLLQLLTDTTLKNNHNTLLTEFNTIRDNALNKVSKAETSKTDTDISDAKSYVLANLVTGEFRDGLMARLNAISPAASNKTLKQLEDAIVDAVDDESTSRFKEAVEAYIAHKDADPEDEFEAYVAVYDENSDSLIKKMFQLISDIESYKKKETDKLKDSIEDLLDDMPKKAKAWFEGEYEGTNLSTSNEDVEVKRKDLSVAGRDLYDVLLKQAKKVDSAGAKSAIIELINTLEYEMGTTELNNISKQFNKIMSKEISNKKVRDFFDTLYD